MNTPNSAWVQLFDFTNNPNPHASQGEGMLWTRRNFVAGLDRTMDLVGAHPTVCAHCGPSADVAVIVLTDMYGTGRSLMPALAITTFICARKEAQDVQPDT
jgi:hypothetical protein